MEPFSKNGRTYFKGDIETVEQTNSLQPNQISQGLYKCSPMAKKLLAYVISDLKIVKWTNSNFVSYETIFTTSDFLKTLGLKRVGSKTRTLIQQALIELQKSYIAIDTGDKFETFPWVTHSVFAEPERKIAIELNHHLGQALMEIKKGFTVIQLIELGKLQSFYAMRFYEIAQSWKGKKGKEGNKKNEWFFAYSVEEIRKIFQMKDDEYSGRMNNFTTKVIDNPLEEVNEKTNLNIVYEKIKDGKAVIGFKFTCSEKVEPLKIAKTDSKKLKQEKIDLNEERQKCEELKQNHAKRYAEILEQVQMQKTLFQPPPMFQEAEALKILKEELGLSD